MGRLLIVDDEPNLRRVLSSELHLDGHTVDEADGVLAALPLLAEREYDAVITDQKMPDGDGLRVLSVAQENDPSLPVIFLTAVPTIELAVESMRKGAFDFITKPFNPEVVTATVRRACERTNLVRENQLLKSAVDTVPEDRKAAKIGFRRYCLMRPDRSDGAGHRPAHEKQQDPELLNELCRQVFAFSSPAESS